jgi:hypothetical protein
MSKEKVIKKVEELSKKIGTTKGDTIRLCVDLAHILVSEIEKGATIISEMPPKNPDIPCIRDRTIIKIPVIVD